MVPYNVFRINRLTDYALVILGRLASAGRGGSQSAAELAEATQLPLPTVTKVLKVLAREGVLDSVRGVRGGYRLVRPAEALTVLEVLEAMEGPVSVTECVESGEAGCAYEARCAARGPWSRINVALRSALAEVVLADLDATAAASPLVPMPAQAGGCSSGTCGSVSVAGASR